MTGMNYSQMGAEGVEAAGLLRTEIVPLLFLFYGFFHNAEFRCGYFQ